MDFKRSGWLRLTRFFKTKKHDMKVVFLKGVAGNDFVYKKGSEYDLEAKQATEFIEAGFAEKVQTKRTATSKTKRTTRKTAK